MSIKNYEIPQHRNLERTFANHANIGPVAGIEPALLPARLSHATHTQTHRAEFDKACHKPPDKGQEILTNLKSKRH